MRILGISASLRNARFGAGSVDFIKEIKSCQTREQLNEHLDKQAKIRIFEFMEAGRENAEPFDVIYRNLRRNRKARGLSNSETALGAGLWGCYSEGVDIDHVGLARHFPMRGEPEHLDELKEKILASDAFLISGPVYFGDRGSVAQEFIEWMRTDAAVSEHLKGKVYAGIAVGAKRNGGQETCLMFQIVDMSQLGMLVVGNDAETTSQYGGTVKAGDIGTCADDEYGLNTSIGTGRRLAHVTKLNVASKSLKLADAPRVSIWMIQDDNSHTGKALIEKWCNEVSAKANVDFRVFDMSQETIYRCIACDLCPTHVGPAEEYRCIINDKNDLFKAKHEDIINTDAVLLAAYSPQNWQLLNSVYQRFIERTRYMRRDDYVMSDILTAPFVISEIDSNQNINVRMSMSLLRHHTILSKSLIGRLHEGEILNWDTLVESGVEFVNKAAPLTAARLSDAKKTVGSRRYNPVGYAISLARVNDEVDSGKVEEVKTNAKVKAESEADKRINSI